MQSKLFSHYIFKKNPLLVLAYMAGRKDEDRIQSGILAILETQKKAVNGQVPTKNGRAMNLITACAFDVQNAVSRRDEVFSNLVNFSDLVSNEPDAQEADVEAIFELVSDGLSLDEIVGLEMGHAQAWAKARSLGLVGNGCVTWGWNLLKQFIDNTVIVGTAGVLALEADLDSCKQYEIRESDRFKAQRMSDKGRRGYGPEDGVDAEEDWQMEPVDDDHDSRIPSWMEPDNQEDPDAEIDESLDLAMSQDEKLTEEEEEHEREFFWGFEAQYPLPSRKDIEEAWDSLKASPYVRARVRAILAGHGPKASEQIALEATSPFRFIITHLAVDQGKVFLKTATGQQWPITERNVMYASTVKLQPGKTHHDLAKALIGLSASVEVREFASRMTQEK